jgi:hypothetical protein
MREDRFGMGSLADMSTVRRDTLLRQLAQSARQQTCAFGCSSGNSIRAAGRALVVLLSRRRVLRVLEASQSYALSRWGETLSSQLQSCRRLMAPQSYALHFLASR